MVAPKGREQKLDGHTFVLYITYKISKFFNPNTTLLQSIFILPALIVMLAIIPAFFIVKKYAGVLGGFIASLLIGLHPYLLGRTPAGFVDTDAYGITMPLFIIWMIIESFSSRSYKMKAMFAALAGVFTWIFKQTWGGGWYFTFDILIAILIGMIIYQIIKVLIDSKEHKKKHIKLFHSRIVRSNILIFAVYMLVTTLLLGATTIINVIKAPASVAGIQNAAHSNLWPNVYTTVAELNTQSLGGITNALISNSLGQIMLFLAMLAIPLCLIKKYNKKSWMYLVGSIIIYLILMSKAVISKISPNFYIILIILTLIVGILINLSQDRRERASILLPTILTTLLVGSIFASTRGIRFVLLGINPFSLMIGLSIGILFIRISSKLHQLLDIPKIATKTIILILVGVIIFNYLIAAHNVGLNETPQMNDGWHNTLTKIKLESDQDAIITSWWDFGHWFKAVADRAVTFDGACQNTPMAHWVGKSLGTDNEKLSVGILRMLDCGSNDAFELLNKQLNNPAITVATLDEMIQLEKEDARQFLINKGIEQSSASQILQKTHCDAPEAYYITSQDMVSKAGVWAHFGFWDFKKADLYYNGKNKDFVTFTEIANKYDYTNDEIENLFDQLNMLETEKEANTWISGWPGYIETGNCDKENNTIICNLGLNIGSQDGANLILETFIFDKITEEGRGIMGAYRGNTKVGESEISIAQFTTEINNELKTFEYVNGIDVAVINIGTKSVISSRELSNSIFTKLFYFDGAYTTHFEKFSDIQAPTGDRIIVWKVDWDGTQDLTNDSPIPIEITIE